MRSRSQTRIAVLSALIAIALTAGGCGDDAEQVSAEELISRGDAICAEGQRRFERVQAQAPATAAIAAEQTEELLDIATDSLNELRGIRPPDELRDRYDAYLEARSRALLLLEQGRDAAADKDAEAYGMAQAKAAAEQRERLRLARAVGFRVCSKR
jgi:hypothetical protein